MLISWSSGEKTEDLKIIEKKFCNTCEMTRPFKLFLRYKFSTLQYIYRWVTERQYMLVCEVCQHSILLDAAKAESILGRNPIPFWTRNGWAFLVIGIIIFSITDFVSYQQTNQNVFINSPQLNDIYIVDQVTLLKDSRLLIRYGLIKVHHVHNERVDFLVKDQTLSFSIPELKDLKKAGTIYGIYRYGHNSSFFIPKDKTK